VGWQSAAQPTRSGKRTFSKLPNPLLTA